MKPGLTRGKRHALFYLLVLVFLIAAPLLIAYSYGYRFDFVKGAVVETGGIFVKSRTSHISIFLNNNFVKETSFLPGGALLPEIQPGTYLLRIEKRGYQPWSKTVEVEAPLVTELRNVVLVPKPVVSATSTKEETALLDTPETSANKLFAKSGNKLVQKTATSSKVLAENVHSFEVLDTVIYFVDRNGFVAKYDAATGVTETIARPGFYLNEEPVRFFKSPAGEVLVIDPAGGLFIIEGQSLTQVGREAEKIVFDSRGKKALVTSKTGVKVLWLAPNTYQPFEKRGNLDTVLTLDAPILDARWFYADDAHVVIRTRDGLFFTEIDGRGGRSTVEFVSGKTDGLATKQEHPNKIFYKIGKNWFTIEL